MSETVLPLRTALGIDRGSVVSLAGGGGKTSLMWALAKAGRALGWSVLTTTTTRIFPPTPHESPALVLLDAAEWTAVSRALAEHGHVTAALRVTPDGKLAGIRPEIVDEWAHGAFADLIMVEADGSAGRPLKAARSGEPVWPSSSTHSVMVMGIDAVGMPLDEEHVFRSALASEITGLAPGGTVTAETVARLLVGPRGLAREAPPASRLMALINRVEGREQHRRAQEVARLLLERAWPRLERVVVGSLRRPGDAFSVVER